MGGSTEVACQDGTGAGLSRRGEGAEYETNRGGGGGGSRNRCRRGCGGSQNVGGL